MDPDLESVEAHELQRKADRLGLPWLHTTTLAELRKMVQERESSMKLAEWVNGTWQINGELPHGIQYRDGKFWVDNEAEPECMTGGYWDGATGGAETCQDCSFAKLCLEKAAKLTLPAAQAKLGAGATLAMLAKEMDLAEQSTLLLMAYAAGETVGIKVKRKPPQDEVPEAQPTPEVPSAEPVPDKKAEEAPKRKRGRPRKDPSQVPAKKKKAKASPELTQALETLLKDDVDPQQAPSAQSATGGALPVEANAENAEAQEGESLEFAWGKHTWLKRWRQERQRNRLIAKLVKGMEVTVTRLGQTHTLTVNKRGYTYRGTEYPTVNKATEAAAGLVARPKQLVGKKRPKGNRPVCNWNAAKFWALDRVLSKG